jgi:HK97 family phage portal protein
MTAAALSISGDDAQVLESRRFTAEELCRVFNCPPPIAGIWENANFASTAMAASWFARFCLLAWAKLIEQEFARSIFNDPRRFYLELDLSGLERGDYPQLMQTNINAVRSGIMSADEARHEIGLDPRGGDADKLMAQSVGGRPGGTEDGQGDSLPSPGAPLNGSGRNGAVA